MRQLSRFALFLILAPSPLIASAAALSSDDLASAIVVTLRSQETVESATIAGCNADVTFSEKSAANTSPVTSRRVVFSFAQVDSLGSRIMLGGANPVLALQAIAGAPAIRQVVSPDSGPEFTSQVLIPLHIAVDDAQELADDVLLLSRLCQPERYGVESTGGLDVAISALVNLWKTSTPIRRVDTLGKSESVEIVRQEIQSCHLFSDLKFTPEGSPSERYFERAHVDLGDIRAAWGRIESNPESGGYLLQLTLPSEKVVKTQWYSSRTGFRMNVNWLALPFTSEASAVRFAGGLRNLARSCPVKRTPLQLAAN